MAKAKPATTKTSSTTKARKASAIDPVASSSRIEIGIDAGDRKEIAEGLARFLADAFTLYLKTHNFHWNVTGPMFNSLHVMFEEQYTEQWNALDDVAERTRALGFNAPGSYAEFIALTSIEDALLIMARSFNEHDFSQYDLDAPFPDVGRFAENSNRSTSERVSRSDVGATGVDPGTTAGPTVTCGSSGSFAGGFSTVMPLLSAPAAPPRPARPR